MKTYALHRISDVEAFDATSYSKFKYGSGNIAREYGKQLLNGFLRTGALDIESCTGNDIIVTASPYKYIPPAATNIAHSFVDELNLTLMELGKPGANTIKINRDVLFEGDYGKLTEQQRYDLLKADRLHMDTEFVHDKVFIVIDDIKITGSHEHKIKDALINLGAKPRQLFFLYYAEMADHDVDPSIEDYLNHFAIKGLNDVMMLGLDSDFTLNARVCKYILSHPEKDKIETLFRQMPKQFVNNLYYASIGDGYHMMPKYQFNFNLLKTSFKQRNGNIPYYNQFNSYREHSLSR